MHRTVHLPISLRAPACLAAGIALVLTATAAAQGCPTRQTGKTGFVVERTERSESRSAEPPRYRYTDYFSPELKVILAKEYRERDGRTMLIKFDRIYPINN